MDRQQSGTHRVVIELAPDGTVRIERTPIEEPEPPSRGPSEPRRAFPVIVETVGEVVSLRRAS